MTIASKPNGVKRQAGFTLLELMITVAIVGILAAIAYPSYTSSITKSKRRAAEACLSNYAQYMERFYTANMRYDQTAATTPVANTLPVSDCSSAQNTGADYSYEIQAVARSTYTIAAVPKVGSVQTTRDAACGTLRLNQAGTRSVTGTSGTANCW